MSLIDKLNNIDISELQNIDYSKALNVLKARPDIIIIVVAICGGLFACSKIYGDNQHAITSSKNEISELEKKIEAIDGYKKAQADLKVFVDQIPEPIDENHLINLITDIAVKRQIQIESFSPSGKKNTALYETVGLSLNLSAESYKNLWLFIHDIEESAYPIHIEKWRASASSGQGDKYKIPVQVEVVSTNIRKNE